MLVILREDTDRGSKEQRHDRCTDDAYSFHSAVLSLNALGAWMILV